MKRTAMLGLLALITGSAQAALSTCQHTVKRATIRVRITGSRNENNLMISFSKFKASFK